MVEQLYLKPAEGKFLALATMALLTDMEEGNQHPQFNWTPEARRDFREIIEAGKSLRIKLAKLGFNMTNLPPFKEGDQDEFLTKES